MRAHALRRTLWFANLALGAGVVAVGAWGVLEVRPATADAARLKADYAAKEREKYMARPKAGGVQNALVTAKDVELIDRPEYRPLNYWIFSGPLPPAPKEGPTNAPVVEQPTGLETIGRVLFVMYCDPEPDKTCSDSLVTWQFSSDKKLGRFTPGDFVHQKGQPQRFKLVEVRRQAPGVSIFELVYDVYDDPKGAPVRRGTLLHDATPKGGSDKFREIPAGGTGVVEPSPAGGDAPAGGGPAAAVAPGEAAPAAPAGPRSSPAFDDLKPTVNRVNVNRVDVEFDQATYDYVRGRNVESFVETVKTQPAKDPRTGQPIGLQITGLSGDSPAMKFDVRPGDILVSINGQAVRDRSDAVGIIQRMDPNVTRVTVVIDRNDKKITYNIDPRDPNTRRAARYLDDRK